MYGTSLVDVIKRHAERNPKTTPTVRVNMKYLPLLTPTIKGKSLKRKIVLAMFPCSIVGKGIVKSQFTINIWEPLSNHDT